MNPTIYPAAPAQTFIVKPSAEFKKEVFKSVQAIIYFFIVYILLVLAAITLSVGFCIAGIALISAIPRLITILAGLGLVAAGLSSVFFLIKFLFSGKKTDNSNRMQIFEQDQPALFAFIRQLAKDTNTQFPKKIFVSPDVNACVFYNSSFWSMFFPVKKNLEIGLGLVNSVNVSEFKAVMAHEFGHFSQQSMKAGSFTYNINQVIFNMLYENEGYSKFLAGWSRIDGILGIFAHLAVWLATAIQSVLKEMYQYVNKRYLGLSRQMEFHADAIAASVAGGNNLVSSLNRLQVSDSCYNTALEKANEFLKQNKRSKNIYHNHSSIVMAFAEQAKLPVQGGQPFVTSEFTARHEASRVNFKNQWASHPTTREREAYLNKLDLKAEVDYTSAWVLFADPEALQEALTAKLYAHLPAEEAAEAYDAETFNQYYSGQLDKYKLPELYKDYYGERFTNAVPWIEGKNEGPANNGSASYQELLSDANCALPGMMRRNEADLEILKAIQDKRIDVKSFDFDGDKYDARSADSIIEKLTSEIKTQADELSLIDEQLFRLAMNNATALGLGGDEQLSSACKKYVYANALAEELDGLVAKINELFDSFRYEQTIASLQEKLDDMKQDHEIKLKARLREYLGDDDLCSQLEPETKSLIKRFIEQDLAYFDGSEFISADLDILFRLLASVQADISNFRFQTYKQLLVQQAAYLN